MASTARLTRVRNFLTGRTQSVVVNGTRSHDLSTTKQMSTCSNVTSMLCLSGDSNGECVSTLAKVICLSSLENVPPPLHTLSFIRWNSDIVRPVKEATYLGVIFTHNMSWDSPIRSVEAQASGTLGYSQTQLEKGLHTT